MLRLCPQILRRNAERAATWALLVGLSASSMACMELGMGGTPSGGDSSDEGDGDGDTDSGEEGASCNDWKVAYCDALDACETFSSREECENDVGFLVCKGDAPVDRCHTEIRAALREHACDDLPGSECAPEEVADRSLPKAACEALHQEVCELQLSCGLTYNTEECMAELGAADPCSEYYAVWPGIEPCLEAYPKLSCSDVLPDVCMGILRD